MTRQFNRAQERAAAKKAGYEITGHGKKIGHGRHNKWLIRHPKLAPFYDMAQRLLGGGARWRAIRKMMVILAQAPKIRPLGGDFAVPYVALQANHQRGSWRSYPSVVIDANLQVAP